jgi:anti-anti-sigma regulatory factor
VILRKKRPALPIPQHILDDLPIAVEVYWPDGLLAHCNQQQHLLNHHERGAIVGKYNVLHDAQNIADGFPEAFERIWNGERSVRLPPVTFNSTNNSTNNSVNGGSNGTAGHPLWLEVVLFPLHTATGHISHIVSMYRNISEQIELGYALEDARLEVMIQREEVAASHRKLAAAQRDLAASQRRVADSREEIAAAREEVAAARTQIALKQQQVQSQQETIQALSSPVVQVWDGILTIPIVGAVDPQRATRIIENVLEAIVQHQADSIIIDITGVAMVDTQVANALLLMVRACRLLGSEVVLVGIGSDVAQTMVRLGIDLSQVTVRANLQSGLAWALRRHGLSIVQH